MNADTTTPAGQVSGVVVAAFTTAAAVPADDLEAGDLIAPPAGYATDFIPVTVVESVSAPRWSYALGGDIREVHGFDAEQPARAVRYIVRESDVITLVSAPPAVREHLAQYVGV